MLARTLLARQHEVTWWTSGFNHSAKCHRTPRTASVTTAKGIRLKLLRGVAYSRNVCIARLVNHYQLGQEFTRASDSEPKPDLIFCCWPTIELGVAAVRYGYRRSVPIILDVRDLWPHLYLDAAPQRFRPLARAALAPYFHMTRSAFRGCSAIVGISEGYLQWGLAHAGRPRGPWDAVFPLGYREPDLSRPPAPEQQEQLRSLGVDESRLLCWFLGSFGDTYDLESVILAARELESRGLRSYQFVLSGVGGNRAHCERLASGLDNVVFTGWLDEDQITCMMRMARVGIAAYRKGAPQGLPNKIFEYMAAGLPVLSSLTGECQTFLEANACGLSYTPGDAGSFLDALLALTTDENRRTQLGANALGAFRSRYSASILYPQLVDHLERIVAAWEHKRPCSAAAA
jgi:glycosyltransferase involved in cell wall biosynthesis